MVRFLLLVALFFAGCEPHSTALPLRYTDRTDGFTFDLPASWQGFSIVNKEWVGYANSTIVERGPLVIIRHPPITSKLPYQDIPVMVFTEDQWNDFTHSKFNVTANGVAEELGRNSKYVFVLPPQYNFEDAEGIPEVSNIILQKPLHGFNSIFL